MKIYEDLITAIEEMINTTTSVMAPYPVDVVGRPSPFGKNKVKKNKKSHREKRAPHTEVEIKEEYEKQNNHREHSPMHKFKYKQIGKIEKTKREDLIQETAELCRAIIAEGREAGESQADFKKRLHTNLISNTQNKLATVKAERRNADKKVKEASNEIKDARKSMNNSFDNMTKAREEGQKSFDNYIKAPAASTEANKAFKEHMKSRDDYTEAQKSHEKARQKSEDAYQKKSEASDKRYNKKHEVEKLVNQLKHLKSMNK